MRRGVRSGELDRRITIQSVSTTNDAITNEEVETFSTFKSNVAAKRLGLQSKEDFEANQQVAVVDARYMIRNYGWAITERMLVVEGSTTYRIKGIDDRAREGFVILSCEKRDNE
jgi:SPP1 family predicted phage head-tail adaptor